MANFLAPLKDEISRLARKETVKVEKELKAAIIKLRSENSELKKIVRKMSKVVKAFEVKQKEKKEKELLPSEKEVETTRVTPESITKLRKKHGLSRLKMGEIFNINHKSIARWEQGIGKPRKESIRKLLILKNMTKREVSKKVKELIAARKEQLKAEKKESESKAKTAPAKNTKKKAGAKKTSRKASTKKTTRKKTSAKKAPAKK